MTGVLDALCGLVDDEVYLYKLRRGDFDEVDKPGSFVVSGYEWLGKIHPQSTEYRIVQYKDRSSNRFGLQAKVNGGFVDVMIYSDGYDDYGKLRPGRWIKLCDHCSWQVNGLKRLRAAIVGLHETPTVVDA